MSRDFTYSPSAVKTRFGTGTIEQIGAVLTELGSRAFLISSPSGADHCAIIQDLIGDGIVGSYNKAVPHTPQPLVEEALSSLEPTRADCMIALGGGSAIGLAKLIAKQTSLPILAVPTTLSGSEMTDIWGLTSAEGKVTGRDAVVRPKIVLYDTNLLAAISVDTLTVSGMNALAHACEGLYDLSADPVHLMMAREAIACMAKALPAVKESPHDAGARSDALYAAWLCGMVLDQTAMALHHKLCHTIGGLFDLPHAPLHTALLPHAIAYNASHAPAAMQAIARSINAKDAGHGLYDLAASLGAEMSLGRIGLPASEIERVVEHACRKSYPNPRPLEREPLTSLLVDAVEGNRPQASAPQEPVLVA